MSEVKPFQDPSHNVPTIRVGEAGPEQVILTNVPRYEGRWDFEGRAAPLWTGEGDRCPERFMGGAVQCELMSGHSQAHYSSRSSV